MPGARKSERTASPKGKTARKKSPSGGARRAARKKADPQPKQLTVKQQLFVEAYIGLARGNATKAAELAGYAGRTRNALHAQAVDVMSLPQVRDAIATRLAQAKKCLTADEVLEEISEQARASIDDFLDKDGKLDLDKARALGKMHLIKKIAWTKDGFRLELRDAHAALVDLGRYHKLFTERHEHTDPDGGPIKHQHGLDDDAAKTLARLLNIHPAQLPTREVDSAQSS